MRFSLFLATVLLTSTFSFAVGVEPGIRLAFSSSGLNYVETKVVDILLQQLDNLEIPDIHESVKTPVGHVNFELTNIRLMDLSVPTRKITLHPPSNLVDTISEVSARVHLDWRYKEKSWPHVRDHGRADVTISGSSISVDIHLAENDKRPLVTCQSCTVDIHNLHLKLHGGASWLYNLFIKTFEKSIRRSVESSLRDSVRALIDKNAVEALSQLPVEERVDKWATVRYGLTRAPEITTAAVALDHHGEFVMNTNPVPFNWRPSPLPALPPTEQRMVQLMLSAETIRSAGHTYYHAGFFSLNVTRDDVPANFPVKLNTTSFKPFLPKLYELYPNAAMAIQLKEVAVPKFVADEQGLRASMPFGLFVFVEVSGGLRPVFSLDITADTHGTVTIANGDRITGDIKFLNTTIVVKKSEIGDFPATLLQTVVNELFTAVLVPAIREKMQEGVPIPTVGGVVFQNPVVLYKDDHIAIGCDLHYTPVALAA